MKTIIIAGLLALSAPVHAWYESGNESRYANRYGSDQNSVRLYSPDGYLGNLNGSPARALDREAEYGPFYGPGRQTAGKVAVKRIALLRYPSSTSSR